MGGSAIDNLSLMPVQIFFSFRIGQIVRSVKILPTDMEHLWRIRSREYQEDWAGTACKVYECWRVLEDGQPMMCNFPEDVLEAYDE